MKACSGRPTSGARAYVPYISVLVTRRDSITSRRWRSKREHRCVTELMQSCSWKIIYCQITEENNGGFRPTVGRAERQTDRKRKLFFVNIQARLTRERVWNMQPPQHLNQQPLYIISHSPSIIPTAPPSFPSTPPSTAPLSSPIAPLSSPIAPPSSPTTPPTTASLSSPISPTPSPFAQFSRYRAETLSR